MINKIPNFNYIPTIGELPSSYLVSMTYEEQLLWLCKYLQETVVPKMNEMITSFNGIDDKLAEFMKELSDNLVEIAENIMNEKIENGEIIVSLGINYNESDEALSFAIDAEPSTEVMETLSTLSTPSEV